MMEFILVSIVVGIVFYGTYKLFELFAKRKERMAMIEKFSNNTDISNMENKQSSPLELHSLYPFGALKIACLLIGVGLGLLVGFFIHSTINVDILNVNDHRGREIIGILYGASVFLFGGIGLLTAFILEMKYSKKKD